MVNVVRPCFAIMALIIHVPNVPDIVLFQIDVEALRPAEQSVLVAAGNVKKLQLFVNSVRTRDEFIQRLPIGRGRKTTDPGKGIEVAETEIERLTAAHRETSYRALLAIRAG